MTDNILTAPNSIDAIPSSRLMNLVERIATDTTIDPARIEQAFEMYKRVRALDAEAEFNQAMALAQAEMEPVKANMRNAHTKKNFADLSAIHKKLKPIWTAHGFAFSAQPKAGPEGYIIVSVTLSHKGGHSVIAESPFPLDTKGVAGRDNKTDIQGMGSSLEYGRRYLECLMMDISVEGKDTDGNPPLKEAEKLLHPAQIKNLLKAIEIAGITQAQFCEKLQIESIDQLQQGRLQGSLNWLKKLSSDNN